jgi:hypothetical protein
VAVKEWGGAKPKATTPTYPGLLPVGTGVAAKLAPSGGSPGRGGYSGANLTEATQSQAELFYAWFGRWPSADERTTMLNQGWTEDTIRRVAVQQSGTGSLMRMAQDALRQIAAPYYDGDPSAISAALVNSLIADGTYADETYLSRTYFPALRGAGLSNPLAQPYVDAWVELTGRAVSADAMTQLDQFVRTYGFTDVAEQAWLGWVKKTDSAITGNFGAEQRATINKTFVDFLGRDATQDELGAGGTFWDMNDAARMEALRATPEYGSIYIGKPDYMDEGEWIDAARAYNTVFHWYYGDEAVQNPDGSISFGGMTGAPGTPIVNGLRNFGIDYLNADMLKALVDKGYTPERLQQDFVWEQQATQYAGTYDDILTEAFGSTFTEDEWRTFSQGGVGSGVLKARLSEAQNRVEYRETYRLVFGVDPDPTDYERIMGQYVAPGELLKQHQAKQSAIEMFDEVNDLLTRVYGEGISVDELTNMALGKEGAGELKALINKATKLDEFTEYHKQYYGANPTPDQYAQYQGYTSAKELQWDIVAQETVKENKADIQEAWGVAFPDQPMISEEDLYKMYAGREGYGELKYKVGEAQEKFQEQKAAEDWKWRGAEHADIGYTSAPGGGFRTSVPGLAEL